jgi:hypothetical protein
VNNDLMHTVLEVAEVAWVLQLVPVLLDELAVLRDDGFGVVGDPRRGGSVCEYGISQKYKAW